MASKQAFSIDFGHIFLAKKLVFLEVMAGKPCVLFLLGGGWKAMCFVSVCLVVAGKPCVLLMWLESQVFCFCLFGGGWNAIWYEEVCFVCRFLAGQKTAKDSYRKPKSNLAPPR